PFAPPRSFKTHEEKKLKIRGSGRRLTLRRSILRPTLREIATLLSHLLRKLTETIGELGDVTIPVLTGPIELRHTRRDLLERLLNILTSLLNLLRHLLDRLRGHTLLHGVLHVVVKNSVPPTGEDLHGH
ncbi:hypothetical protein ACT3SY_20215, partial [Brachybacterium sp. AOP42-E1-35]|uniref:hypothetical protein n=1 Tax=Brachybacterium sp. AOP42-E1-35 TaxID=3457664 RepID=UPI00402AF4BC